MIRVLLVEDDEVFRLGITVSLKQYDNIELVGTCLDGKTAIETVDELASLMKNSNLVDFCYLQ